VDKLPGLGRKVGVHRAIACISGLEVYGPRGDSCKHVLTAGTGLNRQGTDADARVAGRVVVEAVIRKARNAGDRHGGSACAGARPQPQNTQINGCAFLDGQLRGQVKVSGYPDVQLLGTRVDLMECETPLRIRYGGACTGLQADSYPRHGLACIFGKNKAAHAGHVRIGRRLLGQPQCAQHQRCRIRVAQPTAACRLARFQMRHRAGMGCGVCLAGQKGQ